MARGKTKSASRSKENDKGFSPVGRVRRVATEHGQDPLSGDESGASTNGTNGGNATPTSPSEQQAAKSSAPTPFETAEKVEPAEARLEGRPHVYEYGVNVLVKGDQQQAPAPPPEQAPSTQPPSSAQSVGEDEPTEGEAEADAEPQHEIGAALAVEEIDTDLYRSVDLWKPSRARGVFGGQVIAQALAAASLTVAARPPKKVVDAATGKEEEQDRTPVLHSMHCYFLLAGDPTRPILYQVQRVRDGGSYVTRSVSASQRGRVIFVLFSSYQVPEPKQPRFAIPLPVETFGTSKPPSLPSPADTSRTDKLIQSAKQGSLDPRKLASESASPGVPHPLLTERLSSTQSWLQFVATLRSPEAAPPNEQRYIHLLERYGDRLAPKTRSLLEDWIRDRRNSAVEIRDALPGMYDGATGLPTLGTSQAFWLRTKSKMRGGLEAQKHALAYASDFYLLSGVPKALGVQNKLVMMASLDHTMWFYDTFDVSDWILYVVSSSSLTCSLAVR